MRNEDDERWHNRWPSIKIDPGKEEAILNADGAKLLQIMAAMNFLHINDSTRAMLRDKYPEVYARLLEAQYADAEQKLVTLLRYHSEHPIPPG
jgi:hypothetical protein